MLTEPTLIKRTNVVMVYPNQQARLAPHNPYVMEVDGRNRNCYNCGGFDHMMKYYRNWETKNKIGEERRLEYRKNRNNGQQRIIEGENKQNLNGNRDLIVLN